MAPLVSTIFVMGVMIAIGALIAIRIGFSNDIRKLMVTLIVNVGMPCIILNGLFQLPMSHELLLQILQVFGLGFLFSCFGILLGWLAARIRKFPAPQARQIGIISGLGNTGTIGIPLCASLFGPKGAVLAAVFDAGMDLCLWTVAVMLLQNRGKFSFTGLKSLLNIPMFAIIGGLLLAALGFTPPAEPIRNLTANLAALASPLAMMYIGMLLQAYFREQRSLGISRLGTPLAVKLLLFPAATAVVFAFLPVNQEVMQVVLVQVAMPTIVVASILFARYGGDEELGAMMTVFSTVLSLLTIPLIMLLNRMII